MVRWQPEAGVRLRAAALELFSTRGFEETTVADIAAAAGLTERTFYRYFTDKREVLFPAQSGFVQSFLDGLAAADADARPLDAIASAVERVSSIAGPFIEEQRPYSRMRQTVISAHPELQERELLKLASLAHALGAALRERGIAEPTASLAAESGVMVFRLAFEQWVAPGEERTLNDIERDVFARLRELNGQTAGLQAPAP